MSRKRKSKRHGGSPEGVQRLAPPKERLKDLLQFLIDLPKAAEEAMHGVAIPEKDEGRLLRFDAAVLLRACNALKAIRLLCEEAHWEFAAPILRQLFELAVNMEYLAKQPDRVTAAFRYSKYGLLQGVQHQQLNLIYDRETGRAIDEERLATLEQMLERRFPEFRSIGKRGKVHWSPSWSGHSARYLAEQSAHRLRARQYELLFTSWSEQAHAAPGALADSMFPAGLSPEEVVASDDVEVIQTIIMAATLFLEIWEMLPRVPQAGAPQRLEWMNAMIEEARKHGAPFPLAR